MSLYPRLSSISLSALRVFEAAARLGSFKAAAAELLVTPAAVSHSIKALEAGLGTLLFERLHRSLRLTRTGEELLTAAQIAFASLDKALASLAFNELKRGPMTLTVSAAPTFASRWLGPRLESFHKHNLGVELRLLADNALADIVHDPTIDVALRYGPGSYGGALHAEPLWDSGLIVPVCAPSLLGESNYDPQHLVTQTLLRVALPSPPLGARKPDWVTWLEAAGIASAAARRAAERGPLFSNTQLALDAAVNGHGIALAPAILVADDLRQGRLIQLSETTLPDPYRFWLLYRKDRAEEKRVRTFAAWIRHEVRVRTHTMSKGAKVKGEPK